MLIVGALLTGLPILLIRAGGAAMETAPGREGLAAWIAQPLTPWTLTVLLILGGWLLWAALAAALIGTAYTRMARRRGRRLQWTLPRPLRALAAVVLGAAAVSSVAGPAAAAMPQHADALTEAPEHHPTPASRTSHRATPPAPAPAPQTTAVTVVRGDTLYGIAARDLGDGDRWPEIFTLNQGRPFPEGRGNLTHPDHIRPGLILTMPGADMPTPPAPPSPRDSRPEPEPSAPPSADDPDECGAPATVPTAIAPTATATTTPSSPGTPVERAPAASPAEHGTGIRLSSHSWIRLGLATALVAAAATVWAYRRVRYVPRAPSATPRLDDPHTAPLPRIIAEIRHRLHRHASSSSLEADTDHEHHDPASAAPPSHQPPPAASTEALTGAWPPAGLGLTGPGAAAAARGLLVTVLAHGEPADHHRHSRVVITADAVTTLLGPYTPLPDSPRLTIAADLHTALTVIDTETLHRSRLLAAADATDLADLHDRDPATAPTPPLLLITTPGTDDELLAAALTQGHHLDIHGLILGDWQAGETLTVATDGTTAHETSVLATPLSVLQPAETLDLLTVLAEAHATTGTPPTGHEPDGGPTPAGPVPAPTADDPTTPPTAAHDTGTVADDHTTPVHDGAATTPVKVRILGDARIDGVGPDQHLRAKSLELLVYLAARDGTAYDDSILEDLMPEASASKAPHRLHTYVYALRKALKHAGGPGTYIHHTAHRYSLDRDSLDVDLWRMQAALADAADATDPDTRVEALRRAVDTYDGSLAADHDYEWAEPYREAIRRQALDAHAALADALTGQPAAQLAVLRKAIRHDPYAETLYRQAMHAHAALRQPDGIRDLRRALTLRLADIDAEPADDTLRLADTLITEIGTRRGTEPPQPRARGAA